MRKVILYIAMSLDGFIAKPKDDLSFLSVVDQKGEDYGYANFIEAVDTIILGRRTYDWVLKQIPEWNHQDKDTYVVTRSPKPDQGNVRFYTGELHELVENLKAKKGRHIFVDGGAQLVNSMMQEDLIDEYIISVIPIFVGAGVRLFGEKNPELLLELVSSRKFDKGLVQLHYRRKRR